MNALIAILLFGATLVMVLEQHQAIQRLHESTAGHVETNVQRAMADVRNTLVTAGMALDPATATQDDLDHVLALHPALRLLALLDRDGTVTVSTAVDDVPAVVDWTEHPARIAAQAGQVYTALGHMPPPFVVVAAPAGSGTGALVGLADPQTLWLDAVVGPVGERGYIYLLDATGTLVTAPPEHVPEPGYAPENLAVFKAARDGNTESRLYRGLSGGWIVGRAAPVSGTEVLVFTETPVREFGPALSRGVALWVLAVVLTAVVGEWLIRRILQSVMGPLERLQQGAKAVSQGDYSFRVRVSSKTEAELAELAQAFNQMVQRVQRHQKEIDAYTNEIEEIVELRARELARKTRQLEVAAEVSSCVSAILDPRELVDTVCTLISEQFSVYHVSIMLVDEETNTLKSTGKLPTLHTAPINLRDDGASVLAWVARQGKTLYVPDVSQERRYSTMIEYPASQCELAIPLKYRERVLGVLNLESEHRDSFQMDERAVYEGLADEIAGALHNAETFVKLEEANRELVQTSLQARQANILKSRFLLNASHKLRTPLNAIIGYSETILSGVYQETPAQALDRQRRILENGRVLQALIEDMLDLSAIETGQLQLDLAWVSLTRILDEIMYAGRALHQNGHPDHELVLRLDLSHLTDPLPPVWVDAERLRYILMSLMSNAIKFTPRGEVVLSADAEDDTILIHVRDTGPGIDLEEVSYLFEPFQHQRGSIEAEGKGTGLGLAVSRLLAMRHGGDLKVQSAAGQGSTFTLVLPRQPDGAPNPPDIDL